MVVSDSPIQGGVSPSVSLPFFLGNRNNGAIAACVLKLRVDETYKLNLIQPLEKRTQISSVDDCGATTKRSRQMVALRRDWISQLNHPREADRTPATGIYAHSAR
jgi:hypothetical protein